MSLKVSLLLDSELAPAEVKEALDETAADPGLRDRYTIYGLIGDALRGNSTPDDGFSARIFERIEPATRFCVDIGASDGLRNSNTALLLREQGWRGVLVEGSDYRFGRLREHWGQASHVTLVHSMVRPEDVEAILAAAGVPAAIDLLNVDIDGNDYWVWRAIERVRPHGHQQQERCRRDLFDQAAQPRECGGIQPMEILDQEHERLLVRKLQEQRDQRVQRLFTLLLRGHRAQFRPIGKLEQGREQLT